jgi:hypothetical protein
MDTQRSPWIGLAGLATTLGACQLVSGLSSYTQSGGSGGGATSSAGTGGAPSSSATSSSGKGGATSSSTTSSSGTGGSGGTSASSGTGGACQTGVICPNSTGCFDLSTDPKHCGACANVCGPPLPSCVGGTCVPAPVDGPYDAVTAITGHPTQVGAYWAFGGMSPSHLTGRRGVTDDVIPAVTVQKLVLGLTVSADGSSVFVVHSDKVFQWDITANAPMLFFSEPLANLVYTGPSAASAAALALSALDGTANQNWARVVNIVGQSSSAFNTSVAPLVATDQAGLYWTTSTTNLDGMSGGGLTYMTINDAPRSYLASDQEPATGFLYWIAQGQVQRAQKTFPAGMPPVTGSGFSVADVQGLVVEGMPGSSTTQVFWLEDPGSCTSPAGKLLKMTWNDPAPTTMAAGLPCPRNLVQDKHNVYFSAGDLNAVYVYRMLK